MRGARSNISLNVFHIAPRVSCRARHAALFSPTEFNAREVESIAYQDWSRELESKRKLMVRADFDFSLFEIVERWNKSGSAPEARRLLRRIYDATSRSVMNTRKRRWCPVMQVPSINAGLIDSMCVCALRRTENGCR